MVPQTTTTTVEPRKFKAKSIPPNQPQQTPIYIYIYILSLALCESTPTVPLGSSNSYLGFVLLNFCNFRDLKVCFESSLEFSKLWNVAMWFWRILIWWGWMLGWFVIHDGGFWWIENEGFFFFSPLWQCERLRMTSVLWRLI